MCGLGLGRNYSYKQWSLYMYSSPLLIRTPLPPKNSVLIREVSFGEGGHLKVFSSPLLIRTPLLPKYSVLIREVSFGDGQHHMQSDYLLPKIVSFIKGVPSRVSFKRGTTFHSNCCQIILSLLEGCPFLRVSFKRGTTVYIRWLLVQLYSILFDDICS